MILLFGNDESTQIYHDGYVWGWTEFYEAHPIKAKRMLQNMLDHLIERDNTIACPDDMDVSQSTLDEVLAYMKFEVAT